MSAGNVKDFIFENLLFNGCRYGVNGFQSGQLSVYGYTGGLVTPDSTPQLAAIDFVNNGGQIFIQGAEIGREQPQILRLHGVAGCRPTYIWTLSLFNRRVPQTTW